MPGQMNLGLVQDPPPAWAAASTVVGSLQLAAEGGIGARMTGRRPRVAVKGSVDDLSNLVLG
jgi:hypothetical protein